MGGSKVKQKNSKKVNHLKSSRGIKTNNVKTKVLLAVLSVICSVIGGIIVGWFLHSPSKEDITNLNASIIREFREGFGDLKEVFIGKTCVDSELPKVENGTIFIDKCSFLTKSVNLTGDGYSIGLLFKSKWLNKEGKKRYLLDIGNSPEHNRISLFIENDYIKGRIFFDKKEYTLKLPLRDVSWKDASLTEDWNKIEIGFDKTRNYFFLEVNGKKVEEHMPFEKSFSLLNTKLFLGSDMSKQNQARGYYDFIYIRKCRCGEIAVAFGEEESNKY